MYDLTIIGGGPAASAAAVYAARKRLKTLLITTEWGGQSVVSAEIYNWIGTPKISGENLGKSFRSHAEEYQGDFLDIKTGEKATKVEKKEGGFATTIESGSVHESKTVLIATGSSRRRLDVPGADTFEHKGVTYCASCDGPLFAGMDTVVVGGGNAGFETAAQLLAYAKSVTLLNRSNEFRADKITVDKVLSHPNMRAIKNARIKEVTGDMFVTGVAYTDTVSGEDIIIPASGVFVEIGQIPNTELVRGLADIDEYGKILVDPMRQRTSQDGIWAAGDCTNGLYHQNNIAAGDAVKALEDLYLWLHAR